MRRVEIGRYCSGTSKKGYSGKYPFLSSMDGAWVAGHQATVQAVSSGTLVDHYQFGCHDFGDGIPLRQAIPPGHSFLSPISCSGDGLLESLFGLNHRKFHGLHPVRGNYQAGSYGQRDPCDANGVEKCDNLFS